MDNNASAVAEICRRLDGIPLAIELAAARVASMSAPEIAGLLDERFRLLTGGRRTAVERHQTLRATVDWSYSMLDEPTRLVFDRLAVFAGSFDARAAEAVVSGEGIERWDVLDALASLVAKSMVATDETDHGVTRYQLLETMRQYARERLDEQNAGDAWRRRHAEYFVGFAGEAGMGVRGPDELLWRSRMRDELDNLRTAVTWALDSERDDDAELGLRVIAYLAWEATMDRAAGVGTWALRAVDRAEPAPSGLRAAVLGAAATDVAIGGDGEGARPLALAALEHGEPPDCPAPGTATFALSLCESFAGRPDEALRLILALELEHAAFTDDQWIVAGLACIASIVGDAGGRSRCRPVKAELALRVARQAGNPSMLVSALFAWGYAIQYDDTAGALAAFDESVALTRAGATDSAVGRRARAERAAPSACRGCARRVARAPGCDHVLRRDREPRDRRRNPAARRCHVRGAREFERSRCSRAWSCRAVPDIATSSARARGAGRGRAAGAIGGRRGEVPRGRSTRPGDVVRRGGRLLARAARRDDRRGRTCSSFRIRSRPHQLVD